MHTHVEGGLKLSPEGNDKIGLQLQERPSNYYFRRGGIRLCMSVARVIECFHDLDMNILHSYWRRAYIHAYKHTTHLSHGVVT